MLTFGYYVPASDDLLRVQFFDEFEGYAWAFPRPDHLSVGICGKVGEDRMSGLRERLRAFMAKFDYGAVPAPVFSHLLPSLSVEKWSNLRLAGDGWALVGDAAGLVDPLTGEGIYYALRSGELVAESLLAGLPASYPERVRQEFSSLALGARIAPLFYHGDFLGGALTTRVIEFAARSKTFLDLLQDLIEGSQTYSGLASRLYRSLAPSLVELIASSAREAITRLSGVGNQQGFVTIGHES
jgi:flavin-dependent dehydrogenase